LFSVWPVIVHIGEVSNDLKGGVGGVFF
jgi:hypothetical protein